LILCSLETQEGQTSEIILTEKKNQEWQNYYLEPIHEESLLQSSAFLETQESSSAPGLRDQELFYELYNPAMTVQWDTFGDRGPPKAQRERMKFCENYSVCKTFGQVSSF
jgi:hypothetical protein